MKHVSGQGPIYIRANETIACVNNSCVVVKDESSSENSTDDEQAIVRTTMFPQHPSAETDEITTVDDNNASTSTLTADFTMNTGTDVVSQRVISCPTCNVKFPHHQIAEHADRCAESAWTGTELQYVSLMSEVERIDNDEELSESPTVFNEIDIKNDFELCDITVANDIKSELIHEIQGLQRNMGTETNRINVQRKSVLDDYVAKRSKCSWFSPKNKIKVVFIGEPAIDDGGPRREFFSGNT